MILVTGSNTYVGKRLVKRLLHEGKTVRSMDTSKPKDIDPKVNFIIGDCLNEKILASACKGIETIYHCLDIRNTNKHKRRYMKNVNISGTKNIIEAAKKTGVKNFIFLSTYEVYGKTKKIPTRYDDPKKPKTKFGKDKLKAEKILWEAIKKDTIAITILRPALITGPEISNPVILISLLMACGMEEANRLYVSGNGDTKFQLLHPDDAIEAMVLAGNSNNARGKIYNLGSDNVLTQMEQVVNVKEKAQMDCMIKHISPFNTRIMSKLLRPFKIKFFTKEHVFFLLNNLLLDCGKAKKDLGWAPQKDNIETIIDTINWYRREKL